MPYSLDLERRNVRQIEDVCSEKPSIDWPLSQRNRISHNYERSREDASTTSTSYAAANDECRRVRGDAAYQTTEFENNDADEVDPFYRKYGVEFSKY